jgi:hypothetical protein
VRRAEVWLYERPDDKRRPYLTQHITTLDSVRMSEVCRMLAYATSC